jgi:hypothetical protein
MQKHPGLLFQGGARHAKRGTGFVVVSLSDKLKSKKVKRLPLVEYRTVISKNAASVAKYTYLCHSFLLL